MAERVHRMAESSRQRRACPGPFLPELQTLDSHAEVQKEKLLAQWLKTSQELVVCVEK